MNPFFPSNSRTKVLEVHIQLINPTHPCVNCIFALNLDHQHLFVLCQVFAALHIKKCEVTVTTSLSTHLTAVTSIVMQSFIFHLSFFSITLSDDSGKPGSLLTGIQLQAFQLQVLIVAWNLPSETKKVKSYQNKHCAIAQFTTSKSFLITLIPNQPWLPFIDLL